jgi:hypothetical protein
MMPGNAVNARKMAKARWMARAWVALKMKMLK